MSILYYESSLKMVFSEEPFFPDEETASEYNDQSGPVEIEEGRTYFVKFYTDEVPSFFKEADFCQREFHNNLFELNFRNFVGLSRIGTLHLYIHNKKITNKLYEVMLDELASKYASLVFSFGSPVGQHYTKSVPGKDSAFIEYLFLQKYLLNNSPDIEAIFKE